MFDMIYFDTLKYVETLQTAGISDVQAHALAKAQQQVVAECVETTLPNRLATKADIESLRKEFKIDIDSLKKEFKTDIESLRKEFKSEIDPLKADVAVLKQDVSILKSDVKWIKWFMGIVIVGLSPLILETVIKIIKHGLG